VLNPLNIQELYDLVKKDKNCRLPQFKSFGMIKQEQNTFTQNGDDFTNFLNFGNYEADQTS